jgi:ABC-type Zn uptake system ZnuABC Zn-binding protein ZnuA
MLVAWSGVALLLLAWLSACGGATPRVDSGTAHEQDVADLQAVGLESGEKLEVVATTNIVGDVVSQVGGDKIDLTMLMGIGVDPHSYVPTPADTAAIHNAHVVMANGAGLEANLDEMITSAGGNAAIIHLSDDLELREAGTSSEAEGEDTHGHSEDDPHVWFDVQNVIQWVHTIEATLSALDPANAEAYTASAEAYIRELEELDAWIVDQVAQIPEANRKLVTNHPSFGYLADRYGLEQVGAVYPVNPSSEPSARDIARLQDVIETYDVPAIFTESTVNPKLAEQVAEDTGVRLIALYSGSLGEPGSGVESYMALMRFNVEAIVGALK